MLTGAPIAAPTSTPPLAREQVRHMLFGTATAVRSSIHHLHKLGYADPNDWSRPILTGRPNEVMAILTKRVDVDYRTSGLFAIHATSPPLQAYL